MKYLSEFVYGGIDGIITTYSIIAGSSGGELVKQVILILGISNVISDGYSMGISRYISSQTEIKQGLLREKSSLMSGLVTFISFVLIGMLPVLPFLVYDGAQAQRISFYIACAVFFLIGVVKGYFLEDRAIRSGIQTLLIGLTAAGLSYGIGKYVSRITANKSK